MASSTGARVATSGLVSEYTGIGVVQRMLFPKLSDLGFHLEPGRRRDAYNSTFGRYRAVIHALARRADAPVFLAMVPPSPLATKGQLVTVVHDLRWTRTRSAAARSYRMADLRYAAARSKYLIAVSESTAAELARFAPKHAGKIRTALLGPGQVDTFHFAPRPAERLLLLGHATHKRNELAAAILVEQQPPGVEEIVTVGVTAEVSRILRTSTTLRIEAHDTVNREELTSLLRGCAWYMHMGMEEGFGLPFLEALASGCQVIAIEQPVTREVLGNAAILLRDGSSRDLATQVRLVTPIPLDVRIDHLDGRTWDRCAEQIAEVLRLATS